MNKLDNKGFIATSLIYSFFLVFLALLLAILSTYISTGRTLNSFNIVVKDKLDETIYIPEIYALGSDCYVEKGVSSNILTTCFKTYHLPHDSEDPDYYKCYYNNTPITDTISLIVSSEPYEITCMVRNVLIDERYLGTATTNIYVVDKLNPESNEVP